MVLVGTFTAINNAGEATGARDAYRICLALADLRSKTIISKGFAKALPDGVDATPTPSFADNPVWAEDAATIAYIKTCQGTKAGDPLNPLYAERIGTASLISEGISEYDNKRYREALAFYRTAMRMPGGDQLRVHNGIYLANWKLTRARRRGPVIWRTGFVRLKEQQARGQPAVPARLDPVFRRPAAHRALSDVDPANRFPGGPEQYLPGNCRAHLPTGPAQLNERLSVLRAQTIKSTLEQSDPAAGRKTDRERHGAARSSDRNRQRRCERRSRPPCGVQGAEMLR